MQYKWMVAFIAVYALAGEPAHATVMTKAVEPVPPLKVTVGGIEPGEPIAPKFAFCQPDGKGRTKDGGNISPAISWSGAPEQTRSFAVVVVDKDVPASFKFANKEGEVIAENAERQDFYHLLLVNIPTVVTSIHEGALSQGVVKGGKPFGNVSYGLTGKNDYEKVAAGLNGGYDGPCPPWNDMRLHNYYFQVYALDVSSLPLPSDGKFDGRQAQAMIDEHTIARGEVVGSFTNTPALIKKQRK